MNELEKTVRKLIRDVADFPKPGISFKDITPVFQNPEVCKLIVAAIADRYRHDGVDVVLGLESRGFLLGLPVAMDLGVPFVLARKKGKLPGPVHSVTYKLEYGSATLEIHKDSIRSGMKVLIHDDVLATGGTAQAAGQLVELCGASIYAYQFLIELSFLNGRKVLEAPVSTFVTY